jgi:DUF4097 and DUF4098 domain-containing protein YvlB
MTIAAATIALALVAHALSSAAQSNADGPVLGGHRMLPTAAFKIMVPTGKLRITAWDRDSVLVRGRVPPSQGFYFHGDSAGVKLGVDHEATTDTDQPTLVLYIPRRSRVSVKTVSAAVEGTGVSGWFYSVSGSIHLSGAATSIEVESINGNLDLDVATPWLRARTGDGHLLLRGAPEDVDAATIGGTLDIAATSIVRAQFGSVSGDIHYVGSPVAGAILEFSDHSGAVDLMLPQAASGVFTLSSIVGRIENQFTQARPIAATPQSVRLSLGRGESQIAVRTFKGTIRIRRQ